MTGLLKHDLTQPQMRVLRLNSINYKWWLQLIV